MVWLRSAVVVSALVGLNLCGPGAATPGLAAGGAKTSLLVSPFFPAVTNRMNPDTGQLGAQVGDGGFAVVSPDGTQVAYSRDIDPCTPEPEGCTSKGDLLVADRDGTGEHVLYHNPLEAVMDIRWSPDGSTMAFEEDGGPGDRAVVLVASDGTVLRTIPGAFGAAFSPDGTRITYPGDGSNIWVMDLASGVETAVTGDGTAKPVPPDWSHDGLHIAYAGNDSGLYVMNADGSGRFDANQQVDGFLFPGNPIFSPNDKQIAFVAEGSVDRFDHVYVMDASGANQHVIADAGVNLSQWIRK